MGESRMRKSKKVRGRKGKKKYFIGGPVFVGRRVGQRNYWQKKRRVYFRGSYHEDDLLVLIRNFQSDWKLEINFHSWDRLKLHLG